MCGTIEKEQGLTRDAGMLDRWAGSVWCDRVRRCGVDSLGDNVDRLGNEKTLAWALPS